MEIEEYLNCKIHGLFPWACYYTEEEVIEMLEKNGCVSCPTCLAEIVGVE